MLFRINSTLSHAAACGLVLTGLLLSACDKGASSDTTAQPSEAVAGEVAVGKPAPAITGIEGGKEWSQLAGKVVLVDFWASWCAPCKEELPELEALHKKYQGSGLEIIGISIDEEKAAMDDFLAHMPLSFTVLHDADGKTVAPRWAPPKMPTSYIVDKTGTVIHIQAGFEAADAAVLDAKIQEALSK